MCRATALLLLFSGLLFTNAARGEDAAPATIPPPPPEQFGYPGNIGPSRGWFVWHKYDAATREVEVGRDPPGSPSGETSGETWKAKVIPWCTTYRSLSYGARPEELLPGERVNVFFNPDGKSKRGYVVHFQDELSQMRGHNHAWQVTEVEPGDRWFRARLWMGNEKKLSDDEWSFWIDLDCEKWRDGQRVDTFPLKPGDHLWMTWVWSGGQRVVKRITDAASVEKLKSRQERLTNWRLIDEGLPGVLKEMTGTTAKLLLYSTYWSQARRLKPGLRVEMLPGERVRKELAKETVLSATVETVKFGGTYGSGPVDVTLRFAQPVAAAIYDSHKTDNAISLRMASDETARRARTALLAATNAQPSRAPGRIAAVSMTALQEAIEAIPDADVKAKFNELLPELERAALRRRQILTLRPALEEGWGTVTTTPGGPEWLRDLVGNEAMRVLDRVAVVDLFDKRIVPKSGKRTTTADDVWIARLKDLPDVENLELQSTAVTNDGMKAVGTLKSLRRLSVTLTAVDGRGIAHLAGLTELRRLSVASSRCTGEGFAALAPLTKLENLNFHSCLVNDAGLAEVGRLSSLERLEIVHTKFTDAGVNHLAHLTNLRRLQIGSPDATGAAVAPLKQLGLRELDLHDGQATDEGLEHASQIGTLRILRVYGPVTDAGVAHLAKLTKLEQLILANASITDAALKSLYGLTRLTNLDVTGCKLSDDAVAALKAAVPSLAVKR